jgi:hypothetical protein
VLIAVACSTFAARRLSLVVMAPMRFVVALVVIVIVASVSQNCTKFESKPAKIDRNNKYHLWPDLISSYDTEHGETLTGFYEVGVCGFRESLFLFLTYCCNCVRQWKSCGRTKIHRIVAKRSI